MDRDNARDTRSPSNRDVRLRRRTGLGGALVTGRALRRRSLNALCVRARHVDRHRQSSFAPWSRASSIPHHPSRGYAGRSRSRDRSVVHTARRRHRARIHADDATNARHNFYFPASIIQSTASSLARSSLARDRSRDHHRERPRASARAHSVVRPFIRGRSPTTHPLRTGTAVNDGQRAARDARRGGRRSRRHGRADDGGSHGEPVHREGRQTRRLVRALRVARRGERTRGDIHES